jgi:threonine aldolase
VLAHEPAANALFVHLPRPAIEVLQAWSFFWDWDHATSMVRWMTSFATSEDDVDRFLDGVRTVLASTPA